MSTLAARLRDHDPAAIREIYEAVGASRGVLAEVGRLLGLADPSGVRSVGAARIVTAAGLDEHLAAVQQEHGTGRSGRRPRARVQAIVQVTGAPLDVLTPRARAACVDDRGPGPAWALASIEIDETGAIRGRLVKEG
jgi:hypothetical protein